MCIFYVQIPMFGTFWKIKSLILGRTHPCLYNDVRRPANFKNRKVHKIAIVTIAEQFGTSDTFHANTETCSYTIFHKQQQPCL